MVPPPCLLDVERLGMELEKAALDMAYERYFNWHSMLKNKSPYSMQGATQTSQACVSRRVSTALNFMSSSNSITAPHIKGSKILHHDFILALQWTLMHVLCLTIRHVPPPLPANAGLM